MLVELDELLLELTSAERVIGTEVPGAVSPVVTSPAGLHATAMRPAHSARVGLLGMFAQESRRILAHARRVLRMEPSRQVGGVTGPGGP